MEKNLFVGVMSGTSLDGIDAVLADFERGKAALLAHARHDFAAELKRELLLLATPGWDEVHRAAVVSQHLARAYASAIEDLLLHAETEAAAVRAIGVHGQTVRHRPDAGYTVQLNAPATLAELTGIDVVADFRSRDMAAGGQGAPLVPAFHAAMFTTEMPRVVVNIGGIGNVTGLPSSASGDPVIGFDCGPGNVLLDAWAQQQLGKPFDDAGRWAAGGTVDEELLVDLLAEPFFAEAPPKSTGRELFNAEWLKQKLGVRTVAPQDVQATLCRLTAATIARAIDDFYPGAYDVLVCGGGARNAALMQMLAEAVAPRPVAATDRAGVAAEHVEALAFAWLAREHLARRTGNLAAVTGARGPRVLGCLYPAG
jgi:anhydro-N-acetylmuramic acid kinase